MQLYKNRYRIESARLKDWDYSSNGYYYITICTKDRIKYFGDVINSKMALSDIGNIMHKYWQEIPNHFSFVKLGEFIVMPNHMHGIIIIEKSINKISTSISKLVPHVETPKLGVSMPDLGINMPDSNSPNTWKPGNLGVIINQYKRICTIKSRKINKSFQWQSRFYDHIIRNEKDMFRIQKYIQNNPSEWKNDDLNLI